MNKQSEGSGQDRNTKSDHPLGDLFGPVKRWNQRPHRPYRDLLIAQFQSSSESVENIRRDIISRLPDSSADPEKVLLVVRNNLSDIRETIEVWKEQVEPLLKKSAAILSAWLCETAEQIEEARIPELYRESSTLWARINLGPPGTSERDLIHYFDDLCDRYTTPLVFVKEQRWHLVQLFKFIERLKGEILVVDDERVANEIIKNDLFAQRRNARLSEIPEPIEGQKMSLRLSSVRGLMEYARILHKDQGMTLQSTWERIVELAEGEIELRYLNYESFKRSYYDYFATPTRSEESSPPEE